MFRGCGTDDATVFIKNQSARSASANINADGMNGSPPPLR